MKKTMSLYLALLALAVIAVVFGAWLRARTAPGPFIGFAGKFNCGDFGLPDQAHNTFTFQALDDRLVAVESLSADGDRRSVGRGTLQSPSLMRFELSMDLVHSGTLPLNPLAEHFFEGHGSSAELVGRREGAELYRFRCSR